MKYPDEFHFLWMTKHPKWGIHSIGEGESCSGRDADHAVRRLITKFVHRSEKGDTVVPYTYVDSDDGYEYGIQQVTQPYGGFEAVGEPIWLPTRLDDDGCARHDCPNCDCWEYGILLDVDKLDPALIADD